MIYIETKLCGTSARYEKDFGIMKILCIGNSFSYDANEYFYKLAKAGGADVEVLNLYIGGCSIERHAKNVKEHLKEYNPQYNGTFYPYEVCSIDEGLLFKDWDVVTVQQVSGLSGVYNSYYPYIETVLEKIKSVCPKAKIFMHETWAYEKDSVHPDFQIYEKNQSIMHDALHEAYYKVADEMKLDGIIPTGDVIASLRQTDDFNVDKGGISLARDGFHLGLTYGRYAAAATWYQALGLGDISSNPFIPDAGEVDLEKLELIKKHVKSVCNV